MPLPADDSNQKPNGASRWSLFLALLPALALTVGIPFANRLEPRVFGLPFLLIWIVSWILLTPPVMATVHWLDHRR